ncbi:lysozyme [Caviibacterium pharyngocola]|uniref:Lysozyme n=1 Tax=Caviibacterium pharyngocola TaxID=28159 RepID=A0A2M8RTA0_9PAST|nr:lysozyme [Caviibacterium pharyngocola]PJG82118.1 glycoside hydrolase [Caviibacterium pharyngocola]
MSKLTKITTGAVCAVGAIIAIVQTDYTDLRISTKGLEIIGNAEGCRRDPYRCPSDVLTVGIGSTEYSGEKINPKKRYTDKEIADRWANDLRIAERCVNRYANGAKMPQGAFDSLTSITFNVGCSKLKDSTLFKMARQGYKPEMCDQFGRWVYAGGKKLKGLENRRKEESNLCMQEQQTPTQFLWRW